MENTIPFLFLIDHINQLYRNKRELESANCSNVLPTSSGVSSKRTLWVEYPGVQDQRISHYGWSILECEI